MIRVTVLVLGLILGLVGVAKAEQPTSVYKQLIQNKMQLLADSQSLVEAESDNHVQRSILIQKYQICLQSVSQRENFANCIIPLQK